MNNQKELNCGIGPLFMDPDPDVARAFFKNKSRALTDMAVLGFNEDTKQMEVESLHPGITFEYVQQNTGFELGKAKTLTQTEAPRENELKILREQVDPNGYVIGR